MLLYRTHMNTELWHVKPDDTLLWVKRNQEMVPKRRRGRCKSPVRGIFPKNKSAIENQLATIHVKQHWLL